MPTWCGVGSTTNCRYPFLVHDYTSSGLGPASTNTRKNSHCNVLLEYDENMATRQHSVVCSEAPVFLEDLNHLNICWRDNTKGHKQYRRFLEYTDDNYPQATEKPTRRGVLDLMFTNKDGLTRNVKNIGGLCCSDHEMVEFGILWAGRRVKSKLTTLNFRREDLALSKSAQKSPKEYGPGGKGS
ncbi:hypothetical protein llap_377 [Limosa lapponica baueri]|uniref:Dtw domain-containing protein 2 n=1 Tax=Limosa lapponica baueri TaxID=1758121 RepID=A0A2I0UTJ5_LIMLA|nr:hypothetical protein llap_377 [Limosa lapponica baueri]